MNPVKIAIYVAIGRDFERSGAKQHFKARVARGLDIGAGFLTASPRIHFNAWEVPQSNKGDILIREAVRQQLARIFAPRPVEFLEIQWGALDAAMAERINAQCDLFVIAGSGYIFPSHGRLPPRFLADARAIARITRPKAALGVGLNTLEGEDAPLDAESLEAFQQAIGSLDLVSVRDEKTAALVAQTTHRPPAITGDPVLFYEHAVPNTPRDAPPYRVGVNIALHGPVSAGNAARDMAAIARLLKRVTRELPVSLHYVAHAPSERMAWWMLRGHGVKLPWNDPAPTELPAFYATLDAHISQMMHSAICAMNRDVPVTGFAYDRKTHGLFELMRLPQYCIPLGAWTPDTVFPVIERMIHNRESLRATIAESRRRLDAETQGFLAKLCALLD